MGLISALFGKGLPDFNLIINDCFIEIIRGFKLYGIIGVLLAVIVLFILNSVKRFKPKKSVFKLFNIINFIYLPLLFGITFGGFGALNFAQTFTEKQLPENVIPSIQMSFPTFQLYLTMNWKKLKKENARLEDAVTDYAKVIEIWTDSNSWVEKKKTKVANVEIARMIYKGIESVVETEIERKGSKSGDYLEVARKMNFIKVSPGFWDEVETKTLDKTRTDFRNKRIKYAILTLIFSSLLILELTLVKIICN